MNYRYDSDLEFLQKISSADLDGLVKILTLDKDGSPRFTEGLTENKTYKFHNPDHAKYWEAIAAELQSFGANTFATLFRGGKGVLYREILIDVCDKMKVNYNKKSSTINIEQNLMAKIVEDAVSKMSTEEIRQLAEEAGVKNFATLSKDAAIGAFISVFRAGGVTSYQILLIVVNAVLKALIGRGLTFVATGTMIRTTAILMGPVGWAITGILTAVDLGSPAYRVTIPAVIQVLVLRQKLMLESAAS